MPALETKIPHAMGHNQKKEKERNEELSIQQGGTLGVKMQDEPFYLRYGQWKGREDGISPGDIEILQPLPLQEFLAGLTFFEINCVFVE